MAGTEGIAPSASCMSARRSAAELRPRKWCSRLGSHQRPPPSDDGALLTELQERIGKGWSGRQESRRQPARCDRTALLVELRPALAAPDGFAPAPSRLTGEWTTCYPTEQLKMVSAAGIAPAFPRSQAE